MTTDLAGLREALPYQGISLGIMGLLASAALVIANDATHDAIAAAEARDLQSSLSQVLPAGFADNRMLEDTMDIDTPAGPRKVYLARHGGATVGAVFRSAARGYAGDIQVLIGVNAAGEVLGVRVVKHAETPGLGDKIEIGKGNWIRSFEGKSLDNMPLTKWAVKKDGGVFDQFAGATITPRAVVKAVREGLAFYGENRATILGKESSR